MTDARSTPAGILPLRRLPPAPRARFGAPKGMRRAGFGCSSHPLRCRRRPSLEVHA